MGRNPADSPLPGGLLSPIRQFAPSRAGGRTATAYELSDARRLQDLARRLQPVLEPHLSRRCTHRRGLGWVRGAVRQIHRAIREGRHRYVFRTDVKGYYDDIDPDILLSQLWAQVTDRADRALLHAYLHRCVHRDGVFRRVDYGIPTGGALSPVMAALYLTPLDRAIEALEPVGVFYVRYTDDLVILAPNRYKFRHAIRVVNRQLTALPLQQHPAKAFIGKLSRGFDGLGSRFDAARGVVSPSPAAVRRFATRMVDRYAHHEGGESLRQFVNRWPATQTFGLSLEGPDPKPTTIIVPHQHDHRPPPPLPRCP